MNHEHKLDPHAGEAPTMAFAEPELISTPCPCCGCSEVFTAVSPPGQREMPLYPACCRCGRERDDLAEFYADPPIQPRSFAGFRQ